MKVLKSIVLLFTVLCIVFSTQSCGKEGACEDVVCKNGGTQIETETACNCDCSNTNYIGPNCENFDPSKVQALLDSGETPIGLFNGGIPLESLYGKMYEDGFMFYLDLNNEIPGIDGMVAAIDDQSILAGWGCVETDVMGISNIEDCPAMENCQQPIPEDAFEGAKIGDGIANTDAILAECMIDGIAAKLCKDYRGGNHENWFLPSRGELNLMFTNLHAKEHGGFAASFYWSSSEFDDSFAWGQIFILGDQDDSNKGFNGRVRAVRTF